jgi:guanidinopropionase
MAAFDLYIIPLWWKYEVVYLILHWELIMNQLDAERLAHYRELGSQGFLEFKHDQTREFFERACKEGYAPIADTFIKHNGFFQAPHTKELQGVDIALVGVPMDQGSPHRAGTRHGPEAARKWSHIHGPVNYKRVIPFESCNVIDFGDVEFTSYSAKERCEDIFKTYSALKDNDVVPLSCGGEHTMSHSILKALGRDKPLGLIHLDAHADTAGAPDCGDEDNDSSLFRRAVMDGVIDPERTVQIGIRGRASILWDFSYDSGMRVITADEVHERGVDHVMAEVREIIGDEPAYLSVDTDAVDAAYMPGTTLPEPFGLTSIQTRNILRGIQNVDLVGADIAELCPAYDNQGISANLVAGLMFEMLCLLSVARVRRTGNINKTHWS